MFTDEILVSRYQCKHTVTGKWLNILKNTFKVTSLLPKASSQVIFKIVSPAFLYLKFR